MPIDESRRVPLFYRLCAIGFAAHLAYNLARDPVIALWARQLGFSPEMAGILMGASTLTGIFTKFLFGGLSDSIGRRRILVLGCTVTAVVPGLYFLGDSFAYLIGVRLLHGLGTATLGPVASAVVADLAGPEERGFRLGTYNSISRGGQLIAPWIGGALIQWSSYRHPFAAAAGAGILALLLLWRWPETTIPKRRTFREHVSRMRTGFREVGSSRPILGTSVAEALQWFATGLLQAMLPIYATEVAGLSPSRAGLLWGVQLAVPILLRPVFGQLSDRWGRYGQIIFGFFLGAAALWWIAWVTSFPLLILACAGYGFGVAVTTSATAAHVTDLCRRKNYGAAHGVFGTIYDIGHWAGQSFSGILVVALGWRGTFGAYAVGLLGAAALFAVLGKSRDTERS